MMSHYNDTLLNDIQQNDTQHNGTLCSDIQLNTTKRISHNFDTAKMTHCIITESGYTKWCCAQCHYAECRGALSEHNL